jgi:hypothetical protein
MPITVPTATATPAATPAITTPALGTFFTGTGFIHRQGATLKIFLMKHRDRLARVFLRTHFDESKPSRATCRPVLHNVYRDDGTRLGEVIL